MHNRQRAAAGVGGGHSSVEAGNDRGAKAPCREHVFIRRKEIRLDQHPTTDETGRPPKTPLAPPEVKSGVLLPRKVSELRWKLGQKAKQEPRFRFYALYDRIYRLDVLEAAWSLVLKNDGAAGVDGVSCNDILNAPDGVEGFLRSLQEELRTKTYQPQAVKRVWLEAVIEETDERGRKTVHRSGQGTPQGGVISPLLANIYLHWFEVRFQRPEGPGSWANAKIVRYADDFVILAHHLGHRIVSWVEGTLEGRFRLTINREKTRVVKMDQPGASLNFLGFTFRYEQDLFGRNSRYLRMEPSRKAAKRLREKVREQTGPQWGWMPLPILIGRLNQTLRGWCAYFRHGHPHRVFHRLDGYLLDKLWRHLRRRSQRRYRTPANEQLDAYLQRHGLQFPSDLEHPVHASRRKDLG
jgi:hypothetical protein